MKKLGLVLAAAAMVAFAGTAMATHKDKQHGNACEDANNNQICDADEDTFTLKGAHFTLNIIGTDREYCESAADTDCFSVKLTGSNRHTIFVGLGSNGNSVKSNIYLQEGAFKVCDGNAFDETYDCSKPPELFKSTNGATFRLPCNDDITPSGDTADPCEQDGPDGEVYTVWARALGKPGGSAEIETCIEDSGLVGNVNRICSMESAVLVRNSGKNYFTEVTRQLTSFVAANGDRFPLFDDDFEDWLWEYNNEGLRLAQLRFYCETCD